MKAPRSPDHSAIEAGKSSSVRSLKRLFPYVRRHRRLLVWGGVVVFLNNALMALQPRIIGSAVDSQLALGHPGKPSAWALLPYAALVVGLTAVAGVFSYFSRQTVIVMSRHIEYDLRNDFLSHVQTLSRSFFLRKSVGDVMALATNDIASVRNVVGPCLLYPMDSVLTFALALAFMFGSDWRLTLYALAPMPAVTWLVFRLGGLIHRGHERRQAQFSELTSKAQENVACMRAVQAYSVEGWEEGEFSRLGASYMESNMRVAKWQSMIWPLLAFLVSASIAITLLAGGWKVMAGTMTIGSLTAFFGYQIMLIWPVVAFGWVANMLQQGAASMARLGAVFDARPDVPEPSDPVDPGRVRGGVEFRGVSFAYEDGHEVLRDVDIEIAPGSTVAVVGHTGSGKSTLVNLLPRLCDPTRGRVLLDGTDIRNISLSRLRGCIGYVQQEPLLFSDTIAENIAYGAGSTDMDAVRAAAGTAMLESDVAGFPSGYSTEIGERGITLSGGQKQRVALARALLPDFPILILDDALSAVDAETESRILHELKKVRENRTCLVVSHRVFAVKDADEIVVLERGRVVERGSHAELLELGGRYAELHARQTLEHELEAL